MITVILNKDIQWSKEDTFHMPVSCDTGFEEGAKLIFDIAKNEYMDPIISKEYLQINDGFMIELTQSDADKLSIDEYIYRIIILLPDGKKVTEKSGNFTVKWGV